MIKDKFLVYCEMQRNARSMREAYGPEDKRTIAAYEKANEQKRKVLDAIEVLEKGLEVFDRERERFRHAKPEFTGEYFLAGGHGDVDSNMLPEYVRIVPAYGCAWEQVYVKTDKTISYEGS